MLGKGDAEGGVPVGAELMHAYARYRVFYGLSAAISPDDATPFVM